MTELCQQLKNDKPVAKLVLVLIRYFCYINFIQSLPYLHTYI